MSKDWTAAALAALDEAWLHGLLRELVETPSPTGSERACAQALTAALKSRGLPAQYQAITDERGNSITRLSATGKNAGGRDLLLYGHFDTSFTGDLTEDFPVQGREPRPDLEPVLRRVPHAGGDSGHDLVTGLGVGNPKGGAACAAAAMDAVARAGVPLSGDLVLGIVSGGIHKRPVQGLARDYVGSAYQGFGIGCEYMLKHGVTADLAISTKPGWGVIFEEPGECWFEVEIAGRLVYSGLRHVVPNRNPIGDAARLYDAFEAWLPGYTARHTQAGSQVSPTGAIGAIEAGWPYKPEFIPAVCRLYANLHTAPGCPPREVRREFAAFIDSVRAAHPDMRVEWQMLLSQPGSRTDPASRIVGICTRAWEATEGRAHPAISGMSGTTDGNLLRNSGIPTVRMGLPGLVSAEYPPMYDACRVTDLRRLAQTYIRAIVEACGP